MFVCTESRKGFVFPAELRLCCLSTGRDVPSLLWRGHHAPPELWVELTHTHTHTGTHFYGALFPLFLTFPFSFSLIFAFLDGSLFWSCPFVFPSPALPLHPLYIYLPPPSLPPSPFLCQCHLYRGVHPLLYESPVSTNWFEDVDQRLLAGLEKGRKEGYIFKGSTIVLLSGWRPGPANINTIRIFQVYTTWADTHFYYFKGNVSIY